MGTEVGDAIGRIIGAPAGSVSMHENVTRRTRSSLSCLPLPAPAPPRLLRGRFPFDDLPAARAGGARLRADDRPGRSGFQRDVQKGRRRDRPHHRAGGDLARALPQLVHPGPTADRRARARGGRAGGPRHYQSAGIIPVDVTRSAWTSRRAVPQVALRRPGQRVSLHPSRPAGAVRPRLTGWFSHGEPFAFDTGAFEPHADARRMMNGTPSIPAWYAALPGLRLLEEVGIGACAPAHRRWRDGC